MKKAVVSVTNDLTTDQRVQRSIAVLRDLGFAVTFVGRQLPESLPFDPPYQTKRFRLWFHKGFFFYAQYNIRLFFFLLFRKYDLYLSNDLDTLLPNYLVANLHSKPLVYDTHEYFTGVPEIQHRLLVKKVWTKLEKWIFPKLQTVITVNGSIADLYEADYGKRPAVVRNISDSFLPENTTTRAQLGLPEEAFILINQGSGINVDRGMEEMLEALKLLPSEVVLMLVGDGDVLLALREKVKRENMENRLIFIPKKPYAEMLHYTLAADVGLSLDKGNNLNYRYSLPNKLFDYIKCGLPVLSSEVVEVRKIVESYDLGLVTDHQPETMAAKIEELRQKGKTPYRENLQRAAAENNWEKERETLEGILGKF